MDMEQLQAFAPILLMVVIFYFMLCGRKRNSRNGGRKCWTACATARR